MKITVVTPVYNGAEYIEQCIRSIMNQTYRNFEHIIMDGGSTDGTVEIIQRYEGLYSMRYYTGKDNGMYDAIANGFDLATGDIFCWLNSDDAFLPWAFEVMQKVISETDAQWCMGAPSAWLGGGENPVNTCLFVIGAYLRGAIRAGLHDGRIFPFLQQESTFWTRELWEKSDRSVLRSCKLAGDYHLWKEFAKYAPLYRIDSVIAGFRRHPGQLSENRDQYYGEIDRFPALARLLLDHRAVKCAGHFLSYALGIIWRRNCIFVEHLHGNNLRRTKQ